MKPSERKSLFEKLFDESAGMIYNLGLRLFNNAEDARDFSQDVFFQAYEKLHSFKYRSKVSTWLYALALNYGLKRIKSEKRLKISYESETFIENTPSEDNNSAEKLNEELSSEETNQQIRTELNTLPEKLRLPLVLYYYEKLSYKEIAKKLALKEGTLKTYIFKGKQQLSDRLRKHGFKP